MAIKAIDMPGETQPGSMAVVSKLLFSTELRQTWEKGMTAIEQAERSVDQQSSLICIH